MLGAFLLLGQAMSIPEIQQVPLRDLVSKDVLVPDFSSSHEVALSRLGIRHSPPNPVGSASPVLPFSVQPASPAWMAFVVGLMWVMYQSSLSPFTRATSVFSFVARCVLVTGLSVAVAGALTNMMGQTTLFFVVSSLVLIFLVGPLASLSELLGKGLMLASSVLIRKGREIL